LLALRIGNDLRELPIIVHMLLIDTNIVIFDVATTGPTARQISDLLKQQDIVITVVGAYRLRVVTHMDVGNKDGDLLIEAFLKI
jgi:threonine aldolase